MNQRIGYARVSTEDQHLDLQRDALQRAGCRVVYEEAASGRNTARSELEQCRRALRNGDTLVVWRLDRLGRSLPDLVQIVVELEHSGVGLESLTEKIETNSTAGKLVFHLFTALAEFERSLIRECTHAGLGAARARGRSGGRKPKLGGGRHRRSRRSCVTPTSRWRTWRDVTASLEPRFTSMSASLPRATHDRCCA